MKIPKITVLGALLGAVAFSGALSAQEPSAFEVFKEFCIDTNLEKAMIGAKAASFGASPLTPPEDDVFNLLISKAGAQASRTVWLVKSGTRQFEVYFMAMNPAPSVRDLPHTDVCHVIFRGDDKQVANDMDRWIGISDNEAIKLPGIDEKIFEFEMIDGKHVPLPKTWRLDPAYSKKEVWTVEISQWRVISLKLERTKPFTSTDKGSP